MKKLLTILCFLTVSMAMFSQPIQTTPVDRLLRGYNPIKPYQIPVKTIIKYKYRNAPMTKESNTKMKVSPRFNLSNDSVNLKKDDINVKRDTTNIRNFIINNNYNFSLLDKNSSSENLFNAQTKNELYGTIASLKLLSVYNRYKTKGTIKIISGIGLQVVSAGMIAYANIPKYNIREVEETHTFEYSYPVYTVTPSTIQITTETTTTISNPNKSGRMSNYSPINDDEFCKPKPPHHPKPKTPSVPPTIIINNHTTVIVNVPIITTTTETKSVVIKDKHQYVEKHERNKTGYYIGAGISALVGAALEISGIIDLHHANVYLTQNSVGMVFKF